MKAQNIITSLLVFCFLPILIKAQSNSEWEKTFGGKRADFANSIIETRDGKLLIVGQSKEFGVSEKMNEEIANQNKNNNDDILFLLLDKDGNVETIKSIGRNKKEGANSVVATFDGGFAIAGYSNSPSEHAQGNQDAWVVKTDENGQFLWERNFGSIEDDQFNDIIQNDRGELIICGKADKDFLLVKLDAQGNTIWQKRFASKDGTQWANALIQNQYDHYIVVGGSKIGKNTKAILIKIDDTGHSVGDPVTYGKFAEEAVDLLETQEGNLAILASTWSRSKSDDIWLIHTDLKGKKIKDFEYGSRNEDTPTSFYQSLDGHFYITGGSKSHSTQAKRDKVFLLKINPEGEEVDEEWPFWGGNFNDKANEILSYHDGSIFLSGYTYSENLFGGNADTWLIKIKKETPIDYATNPLLSAKNFIFVDENKNEQLDGAERGYIQFTIKNEGDAPSTQLKAKVQQTSGSQHLYFPSEIILGKLPANNTEVFSIPIHGKTGLEDNNSTFQITFSDVAGSKIAPVQFEVKSQKEPKPILAIRDHQFMIVGSEAARETPIDLKVTITNTGNKAATKVRGIFSFEKNIENISDKEIIIGSLAAGESKELTFTFKANGVYQGNQVNINFRFYAAEGSYPFGVNQQFQVAVNEELLSPPVLSILDYRFTPNGPVNRNQTVSLEVDISNLGDMDANVVAADFKKIEGITYIGNHQLSHPGLKVGDIHTLKIKLKVKENFIGELAKIPLQLSCPNNSNTKTIDNVCELNVKKTIPAKLLISQLNLKSTAPIIHGEIRTMEVLLTNSGGQSAENIVFTFTPEEGIEAVSKITTSITELAPGQKKNLNFQFKVPPTFKGKNTVITCQAKANGGIAAKAENLSIFLGNNNQQPLLSISDEHFLMPGGKAEKGHPLGLEVTVTNNGKGVATNVRTVFSLERNITIVSDKEIKIGTLQPGESRKVQLEFKIEEVFIGTSTAIGIRMYATEGTYVAGIKKSIDLAIENQPVQVFNADLTWLYPESDFSKVESSLIRCLVISNKALIKENFTVFINGEKQGTDGSKFGEDDLKVISENKNRFKFNFDSKVFLKEGLNEIKIVVRLGDRLFESTTKEINYRSKSINLHFVGIGIQEYKSSSLSDLRFPAKDVKDIAEMFKSQEGKLFNKVNTHLVCDGCENPETDKLSILETIGQLQVDSAVGKIQANDIIVLYISSHGMSLDNQFKILPYNYKRYSTSPQLYTIDFRKDILEQVRGYKQNQVFIFVDACHSGAVTNYQDEFMKSAPAEAASEILLNLVEGERFVRTIMSCQGGESSWEHDSWENGAFTEAMLDAFSNKAVALDNGLTQKASMDDNALSFGELYNFLIERVPHLVKGQFQTNQRPYMPKPILEKTKENDLKFFLLD